MSYNKQMSDILSLQAMKADNIPKGAKTASSNSFFNCDTNTGVASTASIMFC